MQLRAETQAPEKRPFDSTFLIGALRRQQSRFVSKVP